MYVELIDSCMSELKLELEVSSERVRKKERERGREGERERGKAREREQEREGKSKREREGERKGGREGERVSEYIDGCMSVKGLEWVGD